jgi:hypothetical protein
VLLAVWLTMRRQGVVARTWFSFGFLRIVHVSEIYRLVEFFFAHRALVDTVPWQIAMIVSNFFVGLFIAATSIMTLEVRAEAVAIACRRSTHSRCARCVGVSLCLCVSALASSRAFSRASGSTSTAAATARCPPMCGESGRAAVWLLT